MEKIASIIVLIIIFSLELNSQTTKIDSLENLLIKHKKKDTIRVNLLNEAAHSLYRVNIDSALKYTKEASQLANSLNYAKGKAESLRLTGVYFYYKSDYTKAIEYYQKSLKINKEIGNKKEVSRCFNDIGIMNRKLGNPDEAIVYLKKSLKICNETGDKKAASMRLNNIGIIYRKHGNYPKAIEYYQKSMKIREELDDKKGISKCLIDLGLIYKNQGNFPQAMEYYQKSLKINEEIGDKQGISYAFNNIGIIHHIQNNYLLSLEYYQKSMKIKEELGDKKGVSKSFNNIGNIHREQGNYSQALKYYQKSLKLKEEIGDKRGISYSYNNISQILFLQGKYSYAMEYLEKSLEMFNAVDEKLGICFTYENMGAVYLKTKNYKKALDYSLKGLKIAKELELLTEQKNIRKQLSEIYSDTKNYKNAYENFVLYKELNDSIFNEENIKKITGMQYQYEYDKEKQAIELKQQKKDAIQAKEVKLQKAVRNSFIAGFVFMLILVAVVLRSLLQKRKANRILTMHKQSIETKNHQLELQKTEIQKVVEKLKITNKTKDKFFSIIAHDLKSPFNTMLGFSKLLVNKFDKYDKEKQKEFLGILNQSIRNTFNLLENLLLWSSSQRGKIEFKPQKENLQLLINEIAVLVGQTAARKSIIIKNKIPENIIVNADNDMLTTIMRNLISNAIKFTPKEGEIIVNAALMTDENKKKFTEISIKDSGVGIVKEKLARLFILSENISTKGTEGEAGTGLGLTLCEEFVKKHGGKIWVESEVGKGSEFIFTIPITD